LLKNCKQCSAEFEAKRNQRYCQECAKARTKKAKNKTIQNSGEGYIYILWDEKNRLTKIGKSSVPESRIQNWIASYPFPTLKEFCTIQIQNYHIVERELLTLYKRYNTNSEFFNYNPLKVLEQVINKYKENIKSIKINELI
jgi:hypothetical protein